MKKINNKLLFLILAGLIIVIILIKLIDSGDRNFRKDFGIIDTSKIETITLFPASEKQAEINFFKENNKWVVMKNGKKSETRESSVLSMIAEIPTMKPVRLATKNKDKWSEYKLNDTSATRLKVYAKNGKQILDILIGKFSYKQNNQNIGYDGKNVIGTSYVRLVGENEVYAVDGFLSFTFNQGFDYWRNNSICQLNKDDITKITFKYPADSGFIAQKKDSIWLINNHIADKTKMNNFLSSLNYIAGTEFMDDFKPKGVPDYQILIEGNNFHTTEIFAFRDNESKKNIVTSNQNPNSFFIGETQQLFKMLFVAQNELLTGN